MTWGEQRDGSATCPRPGSSPVHTCSGLRAPEVVGGGCASASGHVLLKGIQPLPCFSRWRAACPRKLQRCCQARGAWPLKQLLHMPVWGGVDLEKSHSAQGTELVPPCPPPELGNPGPRQHCAPAHPHWNLQDCSVCPFTRPVWLNQDMPTTQRPALHHLRPRPEGAAGTGSRGAVGTHPFRVTGLRPQPPPPSSQSSAALRRSRRRPADQHGPHSFAPSSTEPHHRALIKSS